MNRSRAARRFAVAYRAAVPAALALLVLSALLGPADGTLGVAIDVVFVGLLGAAAGATALRARTGPSTGAWTLATVGLTLWAAAELVYRVFESDPTAYYPPATQLLLVGAFACAYGTLVLLARERIQRFDPILALDGALAGLTAAAVVAVWLLPDSAEGAQPGVAPLLAALGGLWFVICVLGLTGWRPGWAWGLITLGIALNVIGDVALVQLLDAGEWQRGAIADPLLVSGAALLGMAALLPLRPAEHLADGPRRLPIPLGCGAVALVLLMVAALDELGLAATLLTAGALAVALVRMSVALELVERSRSEARTDPLTQLGNRRRLLDDLEVRLADPAAVEPFTLALFDLDGFKAYNDRFGHLGGDALLERLAGRLADAVAPGRAFRMGGDEFCALIDGDAQTARAVRTGARAALIERGDGFLITASCGTVHCPEEARTPTTALQLADTRMYADKETADRAPVSLPDGVSSRRRPAAADPLRDVGPIAADVARRLGLDDAEVRRIARAAELRDIGKIAVPEDILHKPGRLDDDELRIVRQHTVIGERILRVAPALSELAPLVRASHERFDGDGYPDGLRGEEIPLGGRIVAVCDAYHAMVHRAAHHEARAPLEALRELRRGAGTQFDPRVVSAFGVALRERMSVEAALSGQRVR
ncbi:MAG: HD domain-containing phosphohydrolase [Solirubrobacteraceae bacterium]